MTLNTIKDDLSYLKQLLQPLKQLPDHQNSYLTNKQLPLRCHKLLYRTKLQISYFVREMCHNNKNSCLINKNSYSDGVRTLLHNISSSNIETIENTILFTFLFTKMLLCCRRQGPLRGNGHYVAHMEICNPKGLKGCNN